MLNNRKKLESGVSSFEISVIGFLVMSLSKFGNRPVANLRGGGLAAASLKPAPLCKKRKQRSVSVQKWGKLYFF